MRHIQIFCFLILYVSVAAQINLVPNPSFEQHFGCPDNLDEVYMSNGWSSHLGTPDYLHRCATNNNLTVPGNYFGYQDPGSLSDSAYCAIATISIGSFDREAVGCQLSSPLVIGTKYFVSVAVSAAHQPSSSVQCFTNNMGVLFSTTQYSVTSPAPVNNFAHVFSSNIIVDTTNWVLISGSFIADSAYQYLSIGNFFDDQNTDTLDCTGSYAYYFLDNVCVSTDSLTCNLDVGVQSYPDLFRIDLYPNPAYEFVMIECDGITDVEMFNPFGQSIFKETNVNKCVIDLIQLPNGIYLLQFKSTTGTFTRKLIVNH